MEHREVPAGHLHAILAVPSEWKVIFCAVAGNAVKSAISVRR